ncbi:MAG: hypothetical protein HZB26_06745 [Candidatus Hydrogenedentes bacterium]|nr:hypothetical protein [Candidatus Hydrogenedentota bacterium]
MYDRKKVLIVDDDEDARSFVEAILSSKDWDTFQATTGEEALDIANRETPDLVGPISSPRIFRSSCSPR